MDRSLFFSQRSGSGGGVTPGITPAGMRDFLVFFVKGLDCGSFVSPRLAAGRSVDSADDEMVGGGADSIFTLFRDGSASSD